MVARVAEMPYEKLNGVQVSKATWPVSI